MKIYIIGNGFDLAHGLKTKYSDYREHIAKKKKWPIILDFYPKEYLFWSDIEYNICNLNYDIFQSIKHLYGINILNNLLSSINESFDSFILNIENSIFNLKPTFDIDKNSLFLTFNYTSTLEDIYHIPENNIIYVHNSVAGPALKRLYGIETNSPCIIGHSPTEGDFAIKEFKDNDYLDFVKVTTKRCDEVIKNKRLIESIESIKNKVDEVVFYGFSFSITDKAYTKSILDCINRSKIKISVYYKKEDKQTDIDCISCLKNKIKKSGVDPEGICFLDCGLLKRL